MSYYNPYYPVRNAPTLTISKVSASWEWAYPPDATKGYCPSPLVRLKSSEPAGPVIRLDLTAIRVLIAWAESSHPGEFCSLDVSIGSEY